MIDDAGYVFTYGTLRAGEANDLTIAAEQYGLPPPELLGSATVTGRLYDFGDFPGLTLDDEADAVLGEVYRIARTLIPVLDRIEEVPSGGLFLSRQVRVTVAGVDLQCLIYPIHPVAAGGRPQIVGGDWVAYRLEREQKPTALLQSG